MMLWCVQVSLLDSRCFSCEAVNKRLNIWKNTGDVTSGPQLLHVSAPAGSPLYRRSLKAPRPCNWVRTQTGSYCSTY